MSVDDDRDLIRRMTGAYFEGFTQRAHAVDAVHRHLFRRPLIADAGLDQYLLRAGIDENTSHIHPNSVFIVRRTLLRPQLARDHSEHRSSIEAELGIRNDLNAIIA